MHRQLGPENQNPANSISDAMLGIITTSKRSMMGIATPRVVASESVVGSVTGDDREVGSASFAKRFNADR